MTLPTNTVAVNGLADISDDQLNTYLQTDQTVAQLRQFVGLAGMAVIIQGLSAPGDGGSALYYWNAGAYTDNGSSVIVPPAAAGEGAWLRSLPSYMPPVYMVAGLPTVTAANQGQVAYASNGRNTGEGSGSGTGCLVAVNSAGVWAAVWSGVAVTA